MDVDGGGGQYHWARWVRGLLVENNIENERLKRTFGIGQICTPPFPKFSYSDPRGIKRCKLVLNDDVKIRPI